jgi:hypothetical protein
METETLPFLGVASRIVLKRRNVLYERAWYNATSAAPIA